MEITQEAKVALWGSIQKWGKIATAFRIAERDGSDPVYEENGLHDCPLCLKYNNPGRTLNACGGCPIAEDTNDCGCDGTPYEKWGEVRQARRPGSEHAYTLPSRGYRT